MTEIVGCDKSRNAYDKRNRGIEFAARSCGVGRNAADGVARCGKDDQNDQDWQVSDQVQYSDHRYS